MFSSLGVELLAISMVGRGIGWTSHIIVIDNGLLHFSYLAKDSLFALPSLRPRDLANVFLLLPSPETGIATISEALERFWVKIVLEPTFLKAIDGKYPSGNCNRKLAQVSDWSSCPWKPKCARKLKCGLKLKSGRKPMFVWSHCSICWENSDINGQYVCLSLCLINENSIIVNTNSTLINLR